MIQLTALAQRVLIVGEDSPGLDPLIAPLRDRGCWVETVVSGEDAVKLAATQRPTIVLVGDAASHGNSVELTMRIRSAVSEDATPLFIMIPSCEAICGPGTPESGKSVAALISQLNDLLTGSDANARSGTETTLDLDRVECNGVHLDRVRHRARVDDDELHLTPTEFKLLWELVYNNGYVRSRDELSQASKGATASMQARTIDAHVKAIRRKLKDRAILIETVHGVGYRFRDSEW